MEERELRKTQKSKLSRYQALSRISQLKPIQGGY
jgi:hypothetical protein